MILIHNEHNYTSSYQFQLWRALIELLREEKGFVRGLVNHRAVRAAIQSLHSQVSKSSTRISRSYSLRLHFRQCLLYFSFSWFPSRRLPNAASKYYSPSQFGQIFKSHLKLHDKGTQRMLDSQ